MLYANRYIPWYELVNIIKYVSRAESLSSYQHRAHFYSEGVDFFSVYGNGLQTLNLD